MKNGQTASAKKRCSTDVMSRRDQNKLLCNFADTSPAVKEEKELRKCEKKMMPWGNHVIKYKLATQEEKR